MKKMFFSGKQKPVRAALPVIEMVIIGFAAVPVIQKVIIYITLRVCFNVQDDIPAGGVFCSSPLSCDYLYPKIF